MTLSGCATELPVTVAELDEREWPVVTLATASLPDALARLDVLAPSGQVTAFSVAIAPR